MRVRLQQLSRVIRRSLPHTTSFVWNAARLALPIAAHYYTSTRPGDCDDDGDVDIDDHACFASCMTGPNAGPIGGACSFADVDGDHDLGALVTVDRYTVETLRDRK